MKLLTPLTGLIWLLSFSLVTIGTSAEAGDFCRNTKTQDAVNEFADTGMDIAIRCSQSALNALKKWVNPGSTAGTLAYQDAYRNYVEEAVSDRKDPMTFGEFIRMKRQQHDQE